MKDIPGYEGRYAVTRDGKVWSYFGKGRWLKPVRMTTGYYVVNLGASNVTLVHRIVASTYLSTSIEGAHVNHKNGIKTDNTVENLEWCSQADNNRHAWRTGLCRPPYAIEGDDAFVVKVLRLAYNCTQYELANLFGVGRSTIQRVLAEVR